jgi:hypothetical protein
MARDGRRCRLTSFFRIFVIIPIRIVLGTVSGGAWGWAGGHSAPIFTSRDVTPERTNHQGQWKPRPPGATAGPPGTPHAEKQQPAAASPCPIKIAKDRG